MSMFSSDKIDRLGSRLASFVSTASEKVKEAAERTLAKDTPLERNLKEAISDKNWGCATSVLSEIARASNNYSEFAIISKTVWEALAEPPKRWRRIFKGLTLLEYLLKNGNEKFAEQARDKSYLLRMLQNFSWAEEGRDKGAGIRDKAQLCCNLVFDAGELKEAREIAAKNRDRYIGIHSASSVTHHGSMASSPAGFGSNSLSSISRSYSLSKREGGTGSPSESGPGDVKSGGCGERKEKGDGTGDLKEHRKKNDRLKAATHVKPHVESSDLLGLDFPPQRGAPTSESFGDAFASAGNVWGNAVSVAAGGDARGASCGDTSGFPCAAEKRPPAAPAFLLSSSVADWEGDDLFGGFQGAPPSRSSAAGVGNAGVEPLAVVPGAFAAPAFPVAAPPLSEQQRNASSHPSSTGLAGLDLFSLSSLSLESPKPSGGAPITTPAERRLPRRNGAPPPPFAPPLQGDEQNSFNAERSQQQRVVASPLWQQPFSLTSCSGNVP